MMPSEDERTLLNGSYHPSVKSKSIPLGISSPSSPASSSGSSFYDYLDEKFKLTERNTDVGTEVRAGFVTFVTMAYILIVNAEVRHIDMNNHGKTSKRKSKRKEMEVCHV